MPRRRRDGSRWCRASDIALWRRACEHSPAPLRALPARTPCERYLNLSSKPAGGSQLPPPPPPRRGRSSAIIACITVQSVPGTLEAQNQPIRDQMGKGMQVVLEFSVFPSYLLIPILMPLSQ